MREVEIEVEEKKMKAKVRKVTYGEYNNILQRCIEMKMVGSISQTTINPIKFQRELVNTCVTIEGDIKLENLPAEIGLKLEAEVMAENNLSDESFPKA